MLLIPYCLIVLFLLGFPKEPDPETNIYLEELNKTSTFCEINKIFIELFLLLNFSIVSFFNFELKFESNI